MAAGPVRRLRQGRKAGRSAAARAGRARSKGPAGGSHGVSRTASPSAPPCRQAATARARSVGVWSVAAARSRYRARLDGGESGAGVGGGEPDRVLPGREVRHRVRAGASRAVRAGRGLGGEQVECERVGRAGRLRVVGRAAGVAGRAAAAGAAGAGGARGPPGVHGGQRGAVAAPLGRAERAALRRVSSSSNSRSPRPRIRSSTNGSASSSRGGLVAERRGVLAGVAVVGAAAVGHQIARRRAARLGRRSASACGMSLSSSAAMWPGLGRGGVQQVVPVVVGEGAQPDLRPVGAGRLPCTYAMTRPGVTVMASTWPPRPRRRGHAAQACGVDRGLLHRRGHALPHQLAAHCPSGALPRSIAEGRPAGRRARPGFAPREPLMTASARTPVRPVRVAQFGQGRLAGAEHRVGQRPLGASISAIRSSTVPSAISRCTWTGWVWPMR